jgi:hypothetical protein
MVCITEAQRTILYGHHGNKVSVSRILRVVNGVFYYRGEKKV